LNDVDRLFREFNQPLVRYLTRRLGDRDWAEEVAQETFLRAMKQDTIVSERSWLFAVATNLVRDEARKDIRRRRLGCCANKRGGRSGRGPSRSV
jgi:RNA polymerase sigma-70 factor (ECF subfamily)